MKPLLTFCAISIFSVLLFFVFRTGENIELKSEVTAPATSVQAASTFTHETLIKQREELLPAVSQTVEKEEISSESSSLESLPSDEQKSLWQAFAEARREVHPIPEAWADRSENIGYDLYALHPKQKLRTRFGRSGVQFTSSSRTHTDVDQEQVHTAWEVQMQLTSFAGQPVAAGAFPEKSTELSNRVEYQHSSTLSEWYINRKEGMEHGYTVAARPAHLDENDAIELQVSLSGLVVEQGESESGDLIFTNGEEEILSYSKLKVIDARGRELESEMKPVEDGFLLAYHDTGATYPVTVDPLIISSEDKITANDAAAGDQFGDSVSISGDTVVVGSRFADGAGSNSGSAYVFIRSGSTWNLQQKLTAADGVANDRFGGSVSISGDTMVVGAHFADGAYVFTRSEMVWALQQKLTANDAAAGDRFGISVSVSDDSVVVGAYFDDDEGSSSGSAYVFVRSGSIWNEQQKLRASDADANDVFGESVSISDDTVLIGAAGDDDDGSTSGSAYVFIRSGATWSEQQKLTAGNSAAAQDLFRGAVSISGDTAVVGANFGNGVESRSGNVYVFTRSGAVWTLQQRLLTNDAAAGDQFGESVAISGNTVVVGSNFNDDAGNRSGSAYVFTRSGATWTQQQKLTANDAAISDEFGISVSVSGDTVVVGASQDDDAGLVNSGSTYVFRTALDGEVALQASDWLGDVLLDGALASSFEGLEFGDSRSFNFEIKNVGTLDLDVQSISLGGANAGDFSLVLPDLSCSADLISGESLSYSITFQPSGSVSGERNTVVLLVSNDTPATLSFSISGLALSSQMDSDGDGLNDLAEYRLRSLGFDWEQQQTNLVNNYYEFASVAVLFTPEEAGGITVGSTVVELDPVTNTAGVVLSLQESPDLQSYMPIVADPSKLSIDSEGRIIYEVEGAEGKKFYRVGVSGR